MITFIITIGELEIKRNIFVLSYCALQTWSLKIRDKDISETIRVRSSFKLGQLIDNN